MAARGNRFLYLFVFVIGTASLGSEIAAARLMAPYFGASTLVWANTIGVVLLALSLGYWVGGKLADRDPRLRAMCRMVLLAAVLLAVVPFIARPLFDVSVDALDTVSAGSFIGSLFGVLLLVAVPVTLLGAASPYAIRLSVDSVEGAGSTAGRLYAISTVGSLLGTWLSALVLIPFLGTQRTFLLLAALVALVAVAGLGLRWAPVPAVLALALALPTGTLRASDEGRVILEEETEQQFVQVIEEPDGDRLLELNEGQAIHSLYKPDSYLTGRYWDGLMVLPFAALDGPPERVAILGNAAGTAARMYAHYFPEARVDGVEIDPELTEIGEQYFDLGAPNIHTYAGDARPWLRQSDGDYDVIVVDAYRQPYIPFYLATKEFFDLVAERLAPGGVVVVNVGHPEGNDDLEKVLGRTMAESFTYVTRDPIESANTLMLGSETEASPEHMLSQINVMPDDVSNIAVASSNRIGPRLPGGEVYTDDRAPVEWLIDRSILGYAGAN
jgi:spermidine synthase